MNNSNDQSAILLETVLFDYVAGHLSGEKKRNFEKQLELDTDLQKAVDDERALRNSLSDVNKEAPVSMANFDKLLNKIDASADLNSADNVTDIRSHDNNKEATHDNKVVAFPFGRTSHYRIAASVAAFGVIGILFANFLSETTAPKFETLSDQQASSEINFIELASQGRLAKIVLPDDINQTQVGDLLKSYQLTKVESGSQQNTVYAFAPQAITADDLARWRADARVSQVNVFSAQ